jgi:PAS domain S-box-containing protein
MDGDRYRQLFEATVDYAVFHLNFSGIVETWNAGAERIFGHEGSEIIGQHSSILFTPEDIFGGVPERELKFAIETGRAEDSRWHVRKDGSRFGANGVMVGFRDESGTLTGLAKIVRDDTVRKQAEEQLQYQLNLADAIARHAAEAATELRRLAPEIPIIAMSGYGDVEVMQRFSEAGVDDFLPKPFNPDQLAAKVRQALTSVVKDS